MREISLHILDIVQNSITAGASFVTIEIDELKDVDALKIIIKDNGCGIESEMLKNITDPFVTSRKSRKVGLGLSLFKDACERCEGTLEIKSKVNIGTTVMAVMKYNHIDRPPIGRIEDTLISLFMTSNVDFQYIHRVDDKEFICDTKEIKKIVGEDLNQADILSWIKEYITDNIQEIGGGMW